MNWKGFNKITMCFLIFLCLVVEENEKREVNYIYIHSDWQDYVLMLD